MDFSLFSQLNHEYRALRTGYPEFIRSKDGQLSEAEIPVFVFHTIKPAEFERALLYLSENGYRTLLIDEYFRVITGQQIAPQKSVLLTVDDARLSFWIYGLPLLQKYQATVTLFVIPGMTEEGDPRPSGLDQDYDLRGDTQICNWSELDHLNASGLVDIESHSLFHQQVFVNSKVVDVLDESTDRAAYHTLFSPYLKTEDAARPIGYENLFGLPIFESDSRMSGRAAVVLPDSLRDRAKAIYETCQLANGTGNRREKERLIASLQEAVDKEGFRMETKREIADAIMKDLSTATSMLQNRYGGDKGKHFCLPFTIGSEVMLAAAKEVGLRTCFWGFIPGKSWNAPGADPFQLVRYKHDFIYRLPGRKRKSVAGIYFRKIQRRVSGELVY